MIICRYRLGGWRWSEKRGRSGFTPWEDISCKDREGVEGHKVYLHNNKRWRLDLERSMSKVW